MALLNFDERNMTLNAIAGALEEYKPSKEVKALQKELDKVRNKAKEVHVQLNNIKEKIRLINEKTYPQLKEINAQAEKQAEVETK